MLFDSEPWLSPSHLSSASGRDNGTARILYKGRSEQRMFVSWTLDPDGPHATEDCESHLLSPKRLP